MGINSDDIIAKAVEQYKILKEELIKNATNDIEWFSYLRGFLEGYYKCEDDNKSPDMSNENSPLNNNNKGIVFFETGTLKCYNSPDDITVELGTCKVGASTYKTDELRKEADILQDKICALINEFYDNNGVCGIDVSITPSFENTPLHGRELIATTVKVSVSI